MSRLLVVIILISTVLIAGLGGLVWYGMGHGWFDFLLKKSVEPVTPNNVFLSVFDLDTNEALEANVDFNKYVVIMQCLEKRELEAWQENASQFVRENPQYITKTMDGNGCFIANEYLDNLVVGRVLKGRNVFVVPTNESYIVYAWNRDYYAQKKQLFVDKNVSETVQLRPHLKNASIKISPEHVILGETKPQEFVITLNGTGYYDKIGVCLKWTFGVVNAYVSLPSGENVQNVPYNPSRFLLYDKCFESNVVKMRDESANFSLTVEALRELSGADYVQIVFYDKNRIRIDTTPDWGWHSQMLNGSDVGAPDFHKNITVS